MLLTIAILQKEKLPKTLSILKLQFYAVKSGNKPYSTSWKYKYFHGT